VSKSAIACSKSPRDVRSVHAPPSRPMMRMATDLLVACRKGDEGIFLGDPGAYVIGQGRDRIVSQPCVDRARRIFFLRRREFAVPRSAKRSTRRSSARAMRCSDECRASAIGRAGDAFSPLRDSRAARAHWCDIEKWAFAARLRLRPIK